MMLIVVLSSFTCRYLLSQISQEIRQKKNLQAALFQRYQETAAKSVAPGAGIGFCRSFAADSVAALLSARADVRRSHCKRESVCPRG